MASRKKRVRLRFVKGEIFAALVANPAFAPLFADLDLESLESYGDDPNDSSYIVFDFAEEEDD